MRTVRFTVYGEPKAKGRPRVSVRKSGDGERTFARAYTPKQTVIYENLVRTTYQQMVGAVKLEGEISADIVGVFPIPKSISKKKRQMMINKEILHTKKIDCDNLAKIILDSLNGIAYEDDKQVVRLYVEKIYGEHPRVEVELKEVQD